jgi:O-antigen/teichoic acid export membrane protein
VPSQAARIRWNSFFAFLSQLIRLLTNFLLFVGIARLYGPVAFGQFTTAYSLATIFLLFADFGFDTLLATEIARDRANVVHIAHRYFSLKIIFALCATVFMVLLTAMQHLSITTQSLMLIFSLFVFFSSLNNFFFALFRGIEEFQHETKISWVVNLSTLALIVGCSLLRAPLAVAGLALVAGRVVSLWSAVRLCHRLIDEPIARIDLSHWKNLMGNVLIYGLYVVFGNLFFLVDTPLLAYLRGDHDVGLYQAVFKVVVLALVLQDIATNTMMPVLSRLHSQDKDQWERIGGLLAKTLVFISLPIALVLAVYPEQVITFIYGPAGYLDAAPLMRIFAVVIVVRYSVEAFALMLTSSLRHSMRVLIVFLGTVGNIAINLLLIPRYGPWGAAMTSLATNVVVGVGYLVAVKQFPYRHFMNIRNLGVGLLCIVIFCGLWNWRTISLLYSVPVLLLVYVTIIYFLGYTPQERRTLLRRGDDIAVA